MDAVLFSLCFAFAAAAATAAHPPRPLRQLLTWAITGNLCSLMPSEGRIRGPGSATDGLRVPPINKSSCGAVYSSGHFLRRSPPSALSSRFFFFLSTPPLSSHLLSSLLFFPFFSFFSFCSLSCPFISPLTCPFCSPPSSLPSFFFSSLAALLVSSSFLYSLFLSPSTPLISFPSLFTLPSSLLSSIVSVFLFLFFPLHSFCFFCSHLIFPLSSPLPPYLLFTPRLSFSLSFPPLPAGGHGRSVLLICP